MSSFHTHEVITVNVRGVQTKINVAKIAKDYPSSLLGSLDFIQPYLDSSGHYIFNRNPSVFNAILDFYNTGRLHIPNGACAEMMKKELEFWRISPLYFCPKCLDRFHKDTDAIKTVGEMERNFLKRATTPDLKTASIRFRMWVFLNIPKSSRPARVSKGCSINLFYINMLSLWWQHEI